MLSTDDFVGQVFGSATTARGSTCQDTKTIESYYVSSPCLGVDGKPQGCSVFVAEDCNTGNKADFCI
jgi:hypothetical protein